MKFRSVICVCALAASAAMATDVTGLTSETLGWIKVNSSAKCTIIAVPWVNVGGGNVEVAKLVKTDTLSTDDKLYYYDGTQYFGWQISNGQWVGLSTTKADETGKSITLNAPTDAYALARGKALFIERSDTTKDIYLYGQHETANVSVQVLDGTAEAPAYTLIANPRMAEVNLNSVTMAGTPNSGDKIIVPGVDGANAKEYTYDSSKGGWGYLKEGATPIFPGVAAPRTWSTDAFLPVGRGVWYLSKGGSPTFTF